MMLHKVLNNLTVEVTKTKHDDFNHLSKNQVYARGVLMGAIAAVMGEQDVDFIEALHYVNEYFPENVDWDCVPMQVKENLIQG